MATISNESNHNDEIIPTSNSSTAPPTSARDEIVEEEDGEEFIPPQTPPFSSSSSSLVSTGTTSSSGIFGDIKTNNLLSTNSGSLGDFTAVNNARSSFGSNVSIDSGMEESSNASNESDVSSIVIKQETGSSIISPSSSSSASSTLLSIPPPNLPPMPSLSSHFRQMYFNNPATFYNAAAARFQNAYLMNAVLRQQTPNCWNPYAFGAAMPRVPIRPPFFPQHMRMQEQVIHPNFFCFAKKKI
uniref:Uncharacterized protein n=1 Tax=Panagrolaimus sp. ES5 TaxID=591445 RepID=A0AC34F3T7_9BILA